MTDKVVLITGASQGLGNALSRRFAAEGWIVVASMLDLKEAPNLDGIEGISKIVLDVTDLESIEQGVADTVLRFGAIDLLINNAGYGSFSVVEAASEKLIRRLYETNALGPVFVTRAVLPYMRKRGAGTILFIGSSIASFSAPFHGLYGACKWATDGFAEALTYETADLGIRIKIASPGAMASNYFENTHDCLDDVPDEYADSVSRMRASMGQSLDGAPSPDEVAVEVYAAAIDESKTLRYHVTEQARKMVGHRRTIGDEKWIQRAVGGFLEDARSVTDLSE